MTGDTIKQMALHMLYGQLRHAKISLGNAEQKPNRTEEEISNLQRKIDCLDWLIAVAIKEG